MPKQVTMFILHLDVLGFEAIAQDIEKKTDMVISTKKVRSDFLATIQERVTKCQSQFSDLYVHYEESDHWLILHNDLEILLYIISLILFHNTNYREFENLPLEIAIGKGLFDECSKFSGRALIVEDEVIKFLKKPDLIKSFKDWYKKVKKESIKTTYILIETDCYNDLHSNHQSHCKLIQFGDVSGIYQLDTEYIRTLKDVMSIPSSSMDKSFLPKFHDWRQKEYPNKFYQNPDENTPDTIFICIIPSTTTFNLVNLSADFTKPELIKTYSSGVNVSTTNPAFKPEIYHYLHEYNLLATYIGKEETTDIINTPDQVTLHNKYTDSKIILFSNGVIFGKINHTVDLTLNEKQQEMKEYFFIPDRFLNVNSHRLIVTEAAEKYGTPIRNLIHRDLEQIITILCFLFNPACKEQMVTKPTENFNICIIFPGMILGEIPRALYEEKSLLLYQYRKYKGIEREIQYQRDVEFNDIHKFSRDLRNYIYGYFH